MTTPSFLRTAPHGEGLASVFGLRTGCSKQERDQEGWETATTSVIVLTAMLLFWRALIPTVI